MLPNTTGIGRTQPDFAKRKPSHIPIFPDAYLRDTTHLTCEEHGAYLLLLMAAWGNEDCSLPNDEKRLAALCRMTVAKWRKMAPTVLEFWTLEGERISQKRLSKEWAYVQDKSAKAKAAVAQRRDRADGYERTTNVGTDVVHLGGGGGEGGGGGPYQRETCEGESVNAREVGPFTVIGGGR